LTLEDLGYNNILEQFRIEQNLDNFDIGRVIKEHKERYIVRTDKGTYESEIIGNLRYTAVSRADYPAVGDWVALSAYDSDFAIIHKIFPRRSTIERQTVGKFGEKQIIATNIDYAFIIQAVDRDFNINRLERYLTISYSTDVEPIIVLNKIDLINEIKLNDILKKINKRIYNVTIIPISNKTKVGYERLNTVFKKGKTYCFLGSSGAGKSTLINNLSGKELMKTSSISLSTKKGRHVTSHRELIVLKKGGILIDNPGMREIGIADVTSGLETTFDTIVRLSDKCRFKDCTHIHEKGCAIISAVENGEIDNASYENYLKMERERIHFQLNIAEKRKKDKKFGKMIKNWKKNMDQNKY
jgi:ribosome biogenesis GTPase